MEITNLLKTKFNLQLSLIQYPSGKWGFVGHVPTFLAFVDATPEQIQKGKQFGERFGPKKRIFDTEAEAITTAHAENIYDFAVIKN